MFGFVSLLWAGLERCPANIPKDINTSALSNLLCRTLWGDIRVLNRQSCFVRGKHTERPNT